VQKLQICHDADAACRTKPLHLIRIEVPNIPSAKDIGPSVSGSVQDGVVAWIGQHERPHDHRLNYLGHTGEISSEARRFARGDTITRLQSRVEDHAFHFVKNELRQNQSVSAADDAE
jgi:hypothetical protein